MGTDDEDGFDSTELDQLDTESAFLARHFRCPYCGETVEPPLERDLEGQLVWDCEVCCRPWLIRIHTEVDGTKSVSVDRAQN